MSIILIIWLTVLSFLVFRLIRLTGIVLPGSEGKEGLLEKMQSLADAFEKTTKREQALNRQITGFQIDGLGHIQKISLLRYNPYGDTGGDQSFSLVLLDGKSTGVILTSLHTRAGTRVYAKQVEDGRSELHLSKEEESALNKALS